MSRNNKQKGNGDKKTTITPKPAAAKAEVKEEIPTVATETVTPEDKKSTEVAKTKKEDLSLIRIGAGKSNSHNLSPDSKVQLAVLMQERYVRNPDKTIEKYGTEFLMEVDENIDILVVLSMMDLRQSFIDNGVPLIAAGSGKQLLQLNAACEIFGIQLPKEQLKIAQANPTSEMEVDLNKAVVHEKTKEAIENDRKARREAVEKIPNVDPTAVKDDEDLKKTLTYFLTKQSSNMARNILAVIEFMRNYRNHIAKTADEKLQLEDRTCGAWLEDVLSFVKPSLITGGIISSICNALKTHDNVVYAHVMLSRQLKGNEAVCPLNDEQIADLVRTFIKVQHIHSLPTIDKDGKELPKGDLFETKAVKALYNGNEDLVTGIISCEEDTQKSAYFNALSYYYGVTSKNVNEFVDMNWKELMRKKIGQILNVYLPQESKMSTYSGYPGEITEFPERKAVETPAEEKKN